MWSLAVVIVIVVVDTLLSILECFIDKLKGHNLKYVLYFFKVWIGTHFLQFCLFLIPGIFDKPFLNLFYNSINFFLPMYFKWHIYPVYSDYYCFVYRSTQCIHETVAKYPLPILLFRRQQSPKLNLLGLVLFMFLWNSETKFLSTLCLFTANFHFLLIPIVVDTYRCSLEPFLFL